MGVFGMVGLEFGCTCLLSLVGLFYVDLLWF